MIVVKFGGTSVGSAQRIKGVAQLLTTIESSHDRVIVVLSAVSGTTNALSSIANALYAQEKEEAIHQIKQLKEEYKQLVNELYTSYQYKDLANQLLEENFDFATSFTQDLFTIYEERALLAQGEILSTNLFSLYLKEVNISSVLLNALDFMRIDKNMEPDEYYIASNLQRLVNTDPEEKLVITQGYICRNAFGEIDNLKRGGSDYSATLIGAAIKADEIQIWTDIDGIHNNDPRVIENTKPVKELSYNEAAELAYFGAKILHPSCVWPAQKNNIPIVLKNTMLPNAQGTLISAATGKNRITAMAAKNGITAIKIKSGRMLNAHGFLRKVFEVFEQHKTAIDMIATSEVAVSLTIDDDTHLGAIVSELKKYGLVEVDHQQTIICIVGDFLADHKGYAQHIFKAMEDIPIRMISYGGSKNNVSILIENSAKENALKNLHQGLFN